MENYLEEDEAFKVWNENDEIYDIIMSGDAGIIYKHFLCYTKKKLEATLSEEQKKIFSFLEENIEVFAGALAEEAFKCGYRLGVKEKIDNK